MYEKSARERIMSEQQCKMEQQARDQCEKQQINANQYATDLKSQFANQASGISSCLGGPVPVPTVQEHFDKQIMDLNKRIAMLIQKRDNLDPSYRRMSVAEFQKCFDIWYL